MVGGSRPAGPGPAVTGIAEAYSATAGDWERGPGRVYGPLSRAIVDRSPTALAGASVLDVGAGTGATSRSLEEVGARVVAVDFARGMLAHDAARRPPAVAAGALELPFAPRSFDASVSAFCLNHLRDPAAGLAEMARVTRSGGAVVSGVFAATDSQPVKDVVQDVLVARGWRPQAWYRQLKEEAVPLLATPRGAAEVAAAAGLEALTEELEVVVHGLDLDGLVGWRLGMAHHAPFMAALPPEERLAVRREAVAALDPGCLPLRVELVVLTAVVP